MTITATGQRHIVRALKDALRIGNRHAVEITERLRNSWLMDIVEGDMRTARFLVSPSNGTGRSNTATLYVDQGRGYDATLLSVILEDDDMTRWFALSIEDAFAIAAEINDGRSQAMIDEDDRLEAQAAAEALADNDDFFDMDEVFGPVPENREWSWMDGRVRGAKIAPPGDHVIAQVELGFGGSATIDMAMLPIFSGVDDLLTYVNEQIGVPARLSIGRLNSFDDDHPAGVDKSMPLLDMIVHLRDAPALTATLRQAA